VEGQEDSQQWNSNDDCWNSLEVVVVVVVEVVGVLVRTTMYAYSLTRDADLMQQLLLLLMMMC